MSVEGEQEGIKQELFHVAQGEMIALDREDGFFMVASGSFILFKRNTRADSEFRTQRRISTIHPGGILLGNFSPDDSGYLSEALAVEGCEIRFVPFDNLAAGSSDLDRLVGRLHSL